MTSNHPKKNEIILWIDGHRFDVTEYASKHPGGATILEKYHNKDATEAFNQIRGHHDAHVQELLETMERIPRDSPLARHSTS